MNKLKTLGLMAALIILSNCDVQVRKAKAEFGKYKYRTETRNGMVYGIWYLQYDGDTSQTGYTVAVINLTKEELEVELLKLQITELSNPKK